jgi:hypothetical protein
MISGDGLVVSQRQFRSVLSGSWNTGLVVDQVASEHPFDVSAFQFQHALEIILDATETLLTEEIAFQGLILHCGGRQLRWGGQEWSKLGAHW